MAFTDSVRVHNAITQTATSIPQDVSLREKVSFTFQCANHASGNGVLTIDGSNDGTNWVTGLAFQDAVATASQTYVTSKTLSANGMAGGYFPFCPFKLIRYVCTITTDGTYDVWHQAYGD